ncbi:MAG TPA: serine--tRNA ligase, partial [Planctomycetota bacterium]
MDIKTLRENPDAARAGAMKKRMPDRAAAVDRALVIDAELRKLTTELDEMRATQKAMSRFSEPPPAGMITFTPSALPPVSRDEMRARKQAISDLEKRDKQLRADLEQQMALVPNIPDPEVPEGKDDTENVEVKRWGAVREFDFEPRAHYEIGEAQGWLDFTRAAAM